MQQTTYTKRFNFKTLIYVADCRLWLAYFLAGPSSVHQICTTLSTDHHVAQLINSFSFLYDFCLLSMWFIYGPQENLNITTNINVRF